ncbi:hypothetical protein [Chitinophaga filiformis]|uniref:Uncharacterized protein n=1 Tax=Chitinophaga filiformis TaxID=104663 RepID=A0A1G8CI03_CHIFI|nr:hypothetical protein [Chitinophaga filiformis]SDH44843.1 hypothetical protein SAMN04488121_112144 [Chitinophaga filiformis]
MARAKNNLLLAQVSGTIGKQLTVTQRAGQVILGKAKTKKGKRYKFSPKQLNVQTRFTIATEYAASVKADPDMVAAYMAVAKPGQNANNLAIRDFYNAPEIHELKADEYTGKAGQHIRVRATDDFRVYQVVISIYTASGVLVEEGNALQSRNGIEWVYTARNDNPEYTGGKVRAMAEDLPGNQTFEERVL